MAQGQGVNRTCRTCLGDNVELLPIYNGDGKTIVEMLEYILDTKLEVTDELPQKVCHECFKDISRCFSFKTKCYNSFEILRNQLDKRKGSTQTMHIKVEPGTNITDEFVETENGSQKSLDSSRQDISLIEMASIKTESNVSQPKILMQQSQLYEKEIPTPPTIAAESNNIVENGHDYENLQEQNNSGDVHTVQYVIRELKDELDSVDPLLEVEVNVRHCPYCGAGFGRKSDFSKHMKKCSHLNGIELIEGNQRHDVKKHVCPFCKKAFPRPCRLNSHVERHHGAKQKKGAKIAKRNTCPHCNLSFISEYLFKDHLKTHTKERESNSILNGVVSLEKREFLTNQKKHKCKECSKEFGMLPQLNIHMLLDHKAKQQYVCKLCQKMFYREHDFKTHSILVHKVDRPFKCKFCGTGFSTRSNFIYHEQKCIT